MPLLTIIFNANRISCKTGAVTRNALHAGEETPMNPYGFDIDEAYREDFDEILAFSTFDETEKTINHLEKLCRKYEKLSDKKGVEYCKKIALLGRKRSEMISRNKRVSRQKRLQKKEISEWFRVWLETPDLFGDWLELRKGTEAFKALL